MSFTVLRGLPAHSLRHGMSYLPSRTTSTRQLFLSASLSTPRLRRSFTASTSRAKLKPEDHLQWRRDAVAALKTNRDLLAVPHDPNPTSRGGLIGPECYAPQPEFPRIDLEPIPDDIEIDEANRSLARTRPAPLDVPEQKPDQSKISYYYSVGKTYLTFYKTGIKNIWANWKEFSEIKGWIQPFTITACASYGGGSWEKRTIDPRTGKRESLAIPTLYRREFQLYFRTRHDLLKLLPFSLILLIFGEWTPLVILAFGNRVVPYTCRIPAQQHQSMDKIIHRFQTWRTSMRRLTSLTVPSPKHPFDYTTPRLEHPWRRDLLFAYLVSQTNIQRPLLPILSSFYFHFILQKRLTKYWERIFCDTVLIRREGGFNKLSPVDVYEYASNYGLISLFVIMQHHLGGEGGGGAKKKNYNFINEDLKTTLVPILEKEADAMFNDDFTRLKPAMHWARAYRDTARWASSPDILAAVELMKKYNLEDIAVDVNGKAKTQTSSVDDGADDATVQKEELGQEEWRKNVVDKLNQGRKVSEEKEEKKKEKKKK